MLKLNYFYIIYINIVNNIFILYKFTSNLRPTVFSIIFELKSSEPFLRMISNNLKIVPNI